MSKGEQPRALRQSLKSHLRRAGPPGRGDFSFRDFSHAPSPKNLSKNGLPQKGGSLSVEGVFAKKFSGAGEDTAVGASPNGTDRTCSAIASFCRAHARPTLSAPVAATN